MKWKDNLIYEFINQIISLKWILKPETLWWLNRREKVFSLPCVKRIIFLWSGFGQDGGTRTCNPCAQCLGHALFPEQGERLALPWPSSSSVLNSQGSDRSCLLPGDPTGDIAWRRPPKEHPVLSSRYKKENKCVYIRTRCTDTRRRTSVCVSGLDAQIQKGEQVCVYPD